MEEKEPRIKFRQDLPVKIQYSQKGQKKFRDALSRQVFAFPWCTGVCPTKVCPTFVCLMCRDVKVSK